MFEDSSLKEGISFVLAQSTPNPKRLSQRQSTGSTRLTNGASAAVTLGGLGSALAGITTLIFGMKEEVGIGLAAGSLELPLPLLRRCPEFLDG